MKVALILGTIALFSIIACVNHDSAKDQLPKPSAIVVADTATSSSASVSSADIVSLAEKFYEKSEQLSEKTITLSDTLVNVLSIFLAIFFAFNALNVFQTGQMKKKNEEYLKLLQDEMSERKSMVDKQLIELEEQESVVNEKLAEVQRIASSFEAQFIKAAKLEERLDTVSKYLGEKANNTREKLSKILENFSWKGDFPDDKKEAYTEYYNLSNFVQKLGDELTPDDYKIRSIHCLINDKESEFMFNFNKWIKSDLPTEPDEDPYYIIGNTFRKLDNPEKALVYFNENLKKFPYHSKAWHFKTGILIKMKCHNEVISDADTALKVDPNNANAWYVKTLVYKDQEDYEKALESCNKAIDLDLQIDTISIDDQVLYEKARILVKLGRLEEAWQCAVKATDTLPDNSAAYILQSRILSDLGRYEEALHAAFEAIKIAPNDYKSLIRAAHVYHKMKKHDLAIDYYLKSIEQDRSNPSPYYNIACDYALKANRKMALEFLAKSIAMNIKYKTMARGDDDFSNMWNDPDFLSVTS